MGLKKNTFGASSDSDDVPEEVEHNLIKDSVLELVKSDFREDTFEDLPVGDIRKNVSECDFAGKPVSRKCFEERNWIEEDMSETDNSDDDTLQDDISQDDNIKSEDNISGFDGGDDEDDDGMSDQDENDLEFNAEEEGSGFESEQEGSDSKSSLVPTINIFSRKMKDTQSDIDKGNSIKDQLFIWENLIESRIKLQRGLTCCNSLFQKDELTKFVAQLDKDETSIVEMSQNMLIELLETLIQVQTSLLQACPEYTNFKEGGKKEYDEESDDGKSDKKKRKKEVVNKATKKRKVIQDYAEYFADIDEQFKPFRNSVIQKWNEKTRLAAGKMGISKFAILEQSTIKQIEQMLSDKDRLIKRTQINRSNQEVLGKEVETETNPEDNLEENIDKDRNDKLKNLDSEIFDDSDFYHKLLKDFIDRKTSDITDPTKLGRQWTQLQKLRSKMKHKLDTRATKGRRLRYTVHNKLVNFMAPIAYSTWNEKVESDLFRSLFGQASQVMLPSTNT